MRLVLSWLREFVDVKASAEEIAEKLSLRGFEVASIEPLDGGDAVIDFEITANRPDCLSVLGLAREGRDDLQPAARAAVNRSPCARPARRASCRHDLRPRHRVARRRGVVPAVCGSGGGDFRGGVSGVDDRPAAGRWNTPISPIVDITNYVNLEIRPAVHAFDQAKLAGAEIHARRARPGETITTLDGVARTLDPEMLVIADRDRAQAVAGVMGGADSEVSATTKTVVFESAYFKPASVRRTSKRLGLKTEASTRFERGADIGAQALAIQRAVA
jgi:phenylalanyl-tRNA synthetase beta chain